MNTEHLLLAVAQGDLWTQKRRVQGVRLLRRMKVFGLFQKDIAAVLDVSETVISRYAKQLRKNPTEDTPRSGPPIELGDVFDQIENFIDTKNREHKAVTMGVLMAFVNDKLRIHVTKQALKMHMKRHDFCYKWATPTDQQRLTVERRDVEAYYNALEEQIRGLHPALVFNMDEMGVELFADRKEVKAFVRPNQVAADGTVQVGLPRSARRCTLVACISPNGDAMIPTILTKTKTVHSLLFDRGFSLNELRVFSTENSFITRNIFSRWVNEVFLTKVEEKRARLRRMIGDFDDKVVLIMDGCSAHKIEPFMEVFAQKRIVVRFLVAHSSHLTQPLDLGIFAVCKNIMRTRTQYVISLRVLDNVIVREINDENLHQPPSPERGRLMANFILQILAAFHQATHRENVVSAFEQAGICSRSMGPDPYMVRREVYVDRARAREVVNQLGLYADLERVEELPGQQLTIADLNSELERALVGNRREEQQGTENGADNGAIHPQPRADNGAIRTPCFGILRAFPPESRLQTLPFIPPHFADVPAFSPARPPAARPPRAFPTLFPPVLP